MPGTSGARVMSGCGSSAGVIGDQRVAPGRPAPAWRGAPRRRCRESQAVTACLVSLLVTWMLRGLALSWTGMVRVRTPAA
jgi:hypothetical protein